MSVRKPRIVLISQFRNDLAHGLIDRAAHLLQKRDVSRWIWVTGNNSDSTEAALRGMAAEVGKVEVVRFDCEVLGEDPDSRLLRLTQSFMAGLKALRQSDDYAVLHESDLISPDDVISRLMQLQDGKRAIAGAVWLGDSACWYDTFGARANGTMFTNNPPYHAVYRADEPFQVDSMGSVLLFPVAPVRAGLTLERGGVVELCNKLRKRGLTIWIDPRIRILQPTELWESRRHADF